MTTPLLSDVAYKASLPTIVVGSVVITVTAFIEAGVVTGGAGG